MPKCLMRDDVTKIWGFGKSGGFLDYWGTYSEPSLKRGGGGVLPFFKKGGQHVDTVSWRLVSSIGNWLERLAVGWVI